MNRKGVTEQSMSQTELGARDGAQYRRMALLEWETEPTSGAVGISATMCFEALIRRGRLLERDRVEYRKAFIKAALDA